MEDVEVDYESSGSSVSSQEAIAYKPIATNSTETNEVIRTDETKKAIELGRHYMEKRESGASMFNQLNSGDVDTIGGKEVFFLIFERFYEKLFADNFMKTLFTESKEERPPKEHGQLLGGFIYFHFADDNTYHELRAEGKGHGMIQSHHRAMDCPHRGANVGRRFLHSQMLCWMGHMSLAADEILVTVNNVSKQDKAEFKDKFMAYLARFNQHYSYFMVEED